MTKPALPFIAAPGNSSNAEWMAVLQAAMPHERIVSLADMDEAERQACKVAIVANPRPEELRLLPGLEWVQSVWAGVERLLAELGDTRLRIVRLVDPQLADTMAEAVLAWTLYLHRDMPRYAAQQRERQWRQLDAVRAQERTIALLGLGALGAAAARRLQAAKFKVEGWSRSPQQLAGVHCHAGPQGLREMLSRADILVSLLPLTPETRGLMGDAFFELLGRQASLINFSRGAVVDDEALRRALDRGALQHAVLDVFVTEPLPAESWHWSHPAVTVLPHISAPTDRHSASRMVAAHIAAYRRDGTIPAGVDRARGY